MKTGILAICIVVLGSSFANAQKNGYLGFRVEPLRNGGLHIQSFIKDTPAKRMSQQNPPQLVVGDVMLRLDGRKLFTVRDVFKVTNSMRPGDPPARLDLRMPNGTRYHLYINPAYLENAPCSVSATSKEDKNNKGRPSAKPQAPGRPSGGPGRPSS